MTHAALSNAGAMVTPGADILEDGSTRSVGKVIAVCKDVALVLVRLKAALQAAGNKSTLLVAGSNAAVSPYIPDWWPEEWRKDAASLSSAAA